MGTDTTAAEKMIDSAFDRLKQNGIVIPRTRQDTLSSLKFQIGEKVHHKVYRISGTVVERCLIEDVDSVYGSYAIGYSTDGEKIIKTECHEKWLEHGERADYE